MNWKAKPGPKPGSSRGGGKAGPKHGTTSKTDVSANLGFDSPTRMHILKELGEDYPVLAIFQFV